MTRNLKALGLALIAVFAMSALAAGSASAAEFHCEAETCKIEAVQTTTQKFNSTAGEFTCAKATFTGTMTAKTVSSITVTPTYSECHAIIVGFKYGATVNPLGCTYTFYAAGSADVNCPAGAAIEFVVPNVCTVRVGAQKGLKTVSYTNRVVGTTAHVDMTLNISGIAYSHFGPGCVVGGGTGSGTNGTLTGGATVTAKTTGGANTKIWYE